MPRIRDDELVRSAMRSSAGAQTLQPRSWLRARCTMRKFGSRNACVFVTRDRRARQLHDRPST